MSLLDDLEKLEGLDTFYDNGDFADGRVGVIIGCGYCDLTHNVCRQRCYYATLRYIAAELGKLKYVSTRNDKEVECTNCGETIEMPEGTWYRHCPYCGQYQSWGEDEK